MADQSQGPGWWLASDGKWYPPDQAPAVPPPEMWASPPGGPSPSPGMSTGVKVTVAVVGVLAGLALLGVLALVTLGEESGSTSSQTGTAIDPGAEEPDEGAGDEVASADVPDGYALIEGDGVSIAVPEGWEEVPSEDFAMSPEEFRTAFPDAPEGMFEQGSAFVEQGAVLVAFEVTSGFASNVNIIAAPGEAPLGVVESQVEAQLGTLGAEIGSIERVELPTGEALRVAYTLDVAAPDGSTVPASGVQLYVPRDGSTFIITVSTGGEADEIAGVAGDTFRVS